MAAKARFHETVTVVRGITLEVQDCANCGVIFGITAEFEAMRQRDGRGFHCPNGHSLVFNDSELDRLKRDLNKAQQATAEWREEYAREQARRRLEERRHAATKGQLTRVRKRIAAGVCPHCNRSFQNVARHMATKHAAEATN